MCAQAMGMGMGNGQGLCLHPWPVSGNYRLIRAGEALACGFEGELLVELTWLLSSLYNEG